MARPNSRESLAQYCLRALGEPVSEVNISEEQLEDRIDEAIQYYHEYHSDAVIRTYHKHKITATDIENNFITLPDQLFSVLRVFPLGNSGGDLLSFRAQDNINIASSMLSSSNSGGGGSLVDLEMHRQYMSLIDMTVNGLSQMISFSRHMNQLRIEVNWKESGLILDRYIIIEGYMAINPDIHTDMYNDMMLKKHLTALIKRNFGQNLLKFEGMQLPGGVTINGRAMFDDANAEIQKIEEEYDSKFSYPPDFYTG